MAGLKKMNVVAGLVPTFIVGSFMIGEQLEWLNRMNTPRQPSLRLICFPYAGAGTAVFRRWPALLPSHTEFWAVQLPGRETRFLEPPAYHMEPVVRSVTAELLQLPEMPFAFFGHSMGALIAFETARLLREQRQRLPGCLFVSGNRPPQLQETAPKIVDLAAGDFLEVLQRMNGTPPEILNNPELMELLVPVLRADLSVCQTYRYAVEQPLACPIVAFAGQDDSEAPLDLMAAWSEQTECDFRLVTLPGDHFYLQTFEARFLANLSVALRSTAEGSSDPPIKQSQHLGVAPGGGS